MQTAAAVAVVVVKRRGGGKRRGRGGRDVHIYGVGGWVGLCACKNWFHLLHVKHLVTILCVSHA